MNKLKALFCVYLFSVARLSYSLSSTSDSSETTNKFLSSRRETFRSFLSQYSYTKIMSQDLEDVFQTLTENDGECYSTITFDEKIHHKSKCHGLGTLQTAAS